MKNIKDGHYELKQKHYNVEQRPRKLIGISWNYDHPSILIKFVFIYSSKVYRILKWQQILDGSIPTIQVVYVLPDEIPS